MRRHGFCEGQRQPSATIVITAVRVHFVVISFQAYGMIARTSEPCILFFIVVSSRDLRRCLLGLCAALRRWARLV